MFQAVWKVSQWWRSCPLRGPPPRPSSARPWPCARVFRGKQSPLQPVMLCVTSHKRQRHRGTVINFGALGKMSSRCLFGLSFPTPLPTPSPPRVPESRVESFKPTPPPHAPAVSQPPPLFGGGGGSSSSGRHKMLPDLTTIFFSDHSHFSNPPGPRPPRCLLSVSWWCMMREGLTQRGGAATLHCHRG